MSAQIACPKCGYIHFLGHMGTTTEIECRECGASVKLPPKINEPRKKRVRSHSESRTPKQSSKSIFWILGGITALFTVVAIGCCSGVMFLSNKSNKANEEAVKNTIKWGDSVTFKTLKVKLKSASMAPYSGVDSLGRVYNSSEVALVIVILVETSDKTKIHSAKGSIATATLTDTLGNTLAKMKMKDEIGWTLKINGQLDGYGWYEVRSDDPLTDTLVFERPVEAATDLTLRLNAENFGGTGDIIFEIPANVWKGKR